MLKKMILLSGYLMLMFASIINATTNIKGTLYNQFGDALSNRSLKFYISDGLDGLNCNYNVSVR